MRQGKMIKTYKVSLGRGEPVGPKGSGGDSKTPEGDYMIHGRNPRSKFHLALHISPSLSRPAGQNSSGKRRPRSRRRHHDSRASQLDRLDSRPRRRYRDNWTDGCIAVSNAEMDEIWRRCRTARRLAFFL